MRNLFIKLCKGSPFRSQPWMLWTIWKGRSFVDYYLEIATQVFVYTESFVDFTIMRHTAISPAHCPVQYGNVYPRSGGNNVTTLDLRSIRPPFSLGWNLLGIVRALWRGQNEAEDRTFADFTFDFDLTAVSLDHLFDDG